MAKPWDYHHAKNGDDDNFDNPNIQHLFFPNKIFDEQVDDKHGECNGYQ